ncbi:hypothetical protein DM02DRAFT_664114 [Periconia macrospinosa]|uniref:Uncharacterized protein n=1 Tax=Periconia macrospinosa TaxID=97972 RepID=A0A2V1D226_9PLEO|nr:hypothetical protein DM02DRAFT_664114 [Periconia macrospinosa]
MLQENKRDWPDVVQSALEATPVERMGFWPFYGIPPLPSCLATLLSKLSDKATLDKAVVKWQTYRQERINKVLELIKQMNAKRLPEAERVKLPPGAIWVDQSLTRGDGGELRWLYEPDLVTDAATWVQELENDA